MITFMISLKEEYFRAMYDGVKLHEFRRRFSNVDSPFYALIYVSSPVKAVIAIAKFDKVITGNIGDMIKLRQTHKFSSDDGIKNYFEGCDKCYALPLLDIKKLDNPISLNKLQELVPNFMPPQSFFRVDNKKYSKIVDYVLLERY